MKAEGSLSCLQTKTLISKLTEEKISVLQQNYKLQQELVRALIYKIFDDLLSPFFSKICVLLTPTYGHIDNFT